MKDSPNPKRVFRSGLMMLLLASIMLPAITTAKTKPENEDRFSIGAGASLATNLFKGLDDDIKPALLLDARYSIFFARRMSSFDQQLTVGFDLFQNDSVALSVAASMGDQELEVKNQQLHLGIEDRDAATEAGFVFRYYARIGLFEASYFKDISNSHGGAHSQAKISNPLPGHGKLDIVPGFFFTYYSAKYNNYYYGVTREENIRGNNLWLDDLGNNKTTLEQFEAFRPVYNSSNSIHAGVDVLLTYKLAEHINATAYIVAEDITGEVEGSPLIEDKSIISTLFGINYQF